MEARKNCMVSDDVRWRFGGLFVSARVILPWVVDQSSLAGFTVAVHMAGRA